MNIKSKKEEFALFDKLSDEWWNDTGKFKICLLYTSDAADE